MHEKIVLIGAGSAMFTRGLLADLVRRGEPCELGLVDTDPAALDIVARLADKMCRIRQSPLRLRASTDRRDLLPDATTVICTVGVGGRRAWEQDVLIPRRHGIYQPVGDSVMPGGTSRALRMIPAMVAIAEDVRELAPTALFFNYGNPMAPICRAIRKATGAPVVGLCHGVFQVATYLENLLGIAPGQLAYTAAGMNHLTWFTELRAGGTDLMPRLREIGAGKASATEPTAHDGDNPFTWQLLALFGAFPAVLDRHITEFFPHLFAQQGAYYGKTLGVDAYSLEATIANGDRIFDDMRHLATSPDPLPEDYLERIAGEHEQVLEIVDSIRGDTGRIFSANLPNRGQIPNLPADVIVESPALATATGLRPVILPPLAPGLCGTLATRFQWVETVVEAALEGSRVKVVQALLLDGAVTSVTQAATLADALLAVQADYLPPFP